MAPERVLRLQLGGQRHAGRAEKLVRPGLAHQSSVLTSHSSGNSTSCNRPRR